MIEIKNITKRFGKLQVLKNINLSFNTGECIALLGPNGSGKTTLAKSILGMVIPDSGEIIFKGSPIQHQWKYRDYIGYMPQIGRYPENLTIGQIISLMQDIRSTNQRNRDFSLITTLGLDALMKKKMNTLSGGTRQKVSAALAFMFDPEVLILDEPTAGLDPQSSIMLKRKINDLRQQGKLIIITSHVLSELEDIVDRIVFIQDGEIAYNDSLNALYKHSAKTNLTEAIAYIMNSMYE